MHPILLNLGSIKIYSYGFLIAIGFIASLWLSSKNAEKFKIAPQIISDVYFISLLSGLIGGRLLYVLIYFKYYKNNLLEIFYIWTGGLVFFGGFIAALIAVIVYLKKRKQSFWKISDIVAPGIALGHAFGRLGCFFAGCCYGKECTLPFAVKFSNPDSLAPIGYLLHPTQIYSALSNFIIFFVLQWLLKNKKFDGMVFLSYVMIYSVTRFIIEFFRGDFRGDFYFEFISISQGIGLIGFVVALFFFIKLKKESSGIN